MKQTYKINGIGAVVKVETALADLSDVVIFIIIWKSGERDHVSLTGIRYYIHLSRYPFSKNGFL